MFPQKEYRMKFKIKKKRRRIFNFGIIKKNTANIYIVKLNAGNVKKFL